MSVSPIDNSAPVSGAALDADIAAWLRDEVLAQIAYQGTPEQLRSVLERHDRAAKQLTSVIEMGEATGHGPRHNPTVVR